MKNDLAAPITTIRDEPRDFRDRIVWHTDPGNPGGEAGGAARGRLCCDSFRQRADTPDRLSVLPRNYLIDPISISEQG